MKPYTFEDFLREQRECRKASKAVNAVMVRAAGYVLIFTGILLMSAALSQCELSEPEAPLTMVDKFIIDEVKR